MQPSDRSSHGSNDDHFHRPPSVDAVDAQREKFQSREIATVLSHYDLGVITNIREYRRGSRRSPKLKLETERGEYLLKRKHSGHTVARAQAGHALQGRASAAGVPVAELVPLRSGGTLLALGDRLYEVYEWVQGGRYERDPAQAFEAGVALARLHRAFALLDGEHDHAAAAFEERLETIAQRPLRKRPAVLREHHEHVGLRELLGGGQFKPAVHLHAALGEQLRPLAEKARVRVDFLAAIGLAATDEHAQRLGGGQGSGGEQQRKAGARQ